MRYAVVGIPRGGTSMLMKCLDEGGIPVFRDEARDRRAVAEQLPHNPFGFFELPPRTFSRTFPANLPENCAIKLWHTQTRWLARGIWRVAMLWRDPVHVAASWVSMEVDSGRMASWNRATFGEVKHYLDSLPDVMSVTDLHYDALVDDPLKELSNLVAEGWPLDVVEAAEVPDPNLRHHLG